MERIEIIELVYGHAMTNMLFYSDGNSNIVKVVTLARPNFIADGVKFNVVLMNPS